MSPRGVWGAGPQRTPGPGEHVAGPECGQETQGGPFSFQNWGHRSGSRCPTPTLGGDRGAVTAQGRFLQNSEPITSSSPDVTLTPAGSAPPARVTRPRPGWEREGVGVRKVRPGEGLVPEAVSDPGPHAWRVRAAVRDLGVVSDTVQMRGFPLTRRQRRRTRNREGVVHRDSAGRDCPAAPGRAGWGSGTRADGGPRTHTCSSDSAHLPPSQLLPRGHLPPAAALAPADPGPAVSWRPGRGQLPPAAQALHRRASPHRPGPTSFSPRCPCSVPCRGRLVACAKC